MFLLPSSGLAFNKFRQNEGIFQARFPGCPFLPESRLHKLRAYSSRLGASIGTNKKDCSQCKRGPCADLHSWGPFFICRPSEGISLLYIQLPLSGHAACTCSVGVTTDRQRLRAASDPRDCIRVAAVFPAHCSHLNMPACLPRLA